MPAKALKTKDGKAAKDGDKGTFTLQHGVYEKVHEQLPPDSDSYGKAGEPVLRKVKGTIRHFEQAERVYDEEGIAVGKRTEEHWEIVTDDGAVGFLPEHLLSRG
jgi:cell division septal protein FtsQ